MCGYCSTSLSTVSSFTCNKTNTHTFAFHLTSFHSTHWLFLKSITNARHTICIEEMIPILMQDVCEKSHVEFTASGWWNTDAPHVEWDNHHTTSTGIQPSSCDVKCVIHMKTEGEDLTWPARITQTILSSSDIHWRNEFCYKYLNIHNQDIFTWDAKWLQILSLVFKMKSVYD